MSKAETTAQLNREIADAILGASYFLVSIYSDAGFEKHPLKDLASALKVCPLIEARTKSNRRAMIYAVGANDRSTMIPRDKAEKAVAFLATWAART